MSTLKHSIEPSSTKRISRSVSSEIAAGLLAHKNHSLPGHHEKQQHHHTTIQRKAITNGGAQPKGVFTNTMYSNPLQAFQPVQKENHAFDTKNAPGTANKVPFIQPKLTINAPGDQYEQEADAMADKVMRMRDTSPDQPGSFNFAGAGVQRKCACEEEEHIHRKENSGAEGQADTGLDSYVNSLGSSGQPLPEGSRQFFEPRFGQDFSNVRVHTDTVAAKSAQSISALAYTTGNNIVFNHGQYAPGSASGQRLMAHELTHVVQQNAGIKTKKIQRVYKLDELYKNGSPVKGNPVTKEPDVYFYPGSAINTANRKALVIAGIHGSEPSARGLGGEVNNEVGSGSVRTDFHTIIVPQVNPHPTGGRNAGKGKQKVPDLNREFGGQSVNPIANNITQIVSEFDPERIVSIHAISNPAHGGVFLDPVNSQAYPATGTAADNKKAFTFDQRNLDAMHLTEDMIKAVNTPASVPGNKSTSDRPASQYPGTGAGSSTSSLIYPEQGGIPKTGLTSLGVWASGLGKPTITIEIPGYDADKAVWQTFLPAVSTFLKMPAAPSGVTKPAITPSGSTPPVQLKPTTQPDPPVVNNPVDKPSKEKEKDAEISSPRDVIDRVTKFVHDLSEALSKLPKLPVALPRESPPASLPSSCLIFNGPGDITTRKNFWTGIIAGLTKDELIDWIIGTSLPAGASSAIAEVENQKNCMGQALSISAGKKGGPVQSTGSPKFKQSGRRDFNDQKRIWHSKFIFAPTQDPFDRISDQARTICGSLLLSTETKWAPANPNHRICWGADKAKPSAFPAGTRSLTDDEKQLEILQASSAPGISRHHWGTDFDFFSVEPDEWQKSGPNKQFADEYSWLLGNAETYGFIQAFTSSSAVKNLGYMEERWHWSYWPVAQALLDFVIANQADVELALAKKWGTQPEFTYIKQHWKDYMLNVNQTP